MDGMYLVDDPETPDTIIGIVIGMAQGSMIIPTDRPVIGVVRNTTGDSPLAKLSGRANRRLVKRGINLKDVFVEVAEGLNERNNTLIAEAGGHPMAAGAFIQRAYLDEYLTLVSQMLAQKLRK
jgi:single-stranded DNA-specific DHH superfamily exonuclease